MKLLCNKFAFTPHMCDQCKQYIWMEPYREADVWESFISEYVTKSFCKECAQKIMEGDSDNNEGV